jgi:hypothetical protein
MKIKNTLRISFYQSISSGDWQSINAMFINITKKSVGGHLIINMDDTFIRTLQLTESLKREEEILLLGLITGHSRIQPIFEHVNQWGEISHWSM